MKELKKKLKANELCLGSWITIAHPAIAEIMAKTGFDWLAIDLEHTSITLREAEDLIRTIDHCGISPLVRLTNNDPNLIKRVMDCGAEGIIVPMVNSKAEAEQAVKSVYYPPKGTRGVGLGRASGYGARFQEYKAWADSGPVVIVQIEHIDAVRNLKEILSVEGVDGFMVGPYDLSGSLGLPGQFSHPQVLAALEQIKEVSAGINKPSGFHIIEPDGDLLQQRINEGYKFIAFGVDMRFLDVGCRKHISQVKGKSRE